MLLGEWDLSSLKATVKCIYLSSICTAGLMLVSVPFMLSTEGKFQS